MGAPEVSVIIPAFNAADVVRSSVITLSKELRAAGLSYEIIVVDDGSTDETASCVAAIPEPRLCLVKNPTNLGKGRAIKCGLHQAKARAILFTDDDLPYGSEAVLRCYQALRDGAALAIGDRTLAVAKLRATSRPRQWLSDSCAFLARLLLAEREISDTQCGLKGMTSDFAGEVLRLSRIDRFCFDLELIVIAREAGASITRFPVSLQTQCSMSTRWLIAAVAFCTRDISRIAWRKRTGSYRRR